MTTKQANSKEELIDQFNQYGQNKVPFYFVIDFLGKTGFAWQENKLPKNISFQIQQKNKSHNSNVDFSIKIKPMEFLQYQESFNLVKQNIQQGNTYLCNLTAKTPIQIHCSLNEIFEYSTAKYKLLFDSEFVCFSPERFVKIKGNLIESHPMKGTINANLENAKEQILNNAKEKAEHYTIVDLIRNDLSKIATQVQVEKFRYLSKIESKQSKLLQVSSKITGILPNQWQNHLGNYFFELLPAGSISGAPKKKTIEIIQAAEQFNRQFYTGVFGYFDGKNLDSAVAIRFIGQENNQHYYYSGGGITNMSNAIEEYQELIDKIYVPIS